MMLRSFLITSINLIITLQLVNESTYQDLPSLIANYEYKFFFLLDNLQKKVSLHILFNLGWSDDKDKSEYLYIRFASPY